MSIQNLREFVSLLEKRDQLARVKAPVSPNLEITEITDRVTKGPTENNKALLFENLPGYEMPVLINAFGSPQRMAWGLGVDDLDELNQRLGRLIALRLPQGFGPMPNR